MTTSDTPSCASGLSRHVIGETVHPARDTWPGDPPVRNIQKPLPLAPFVSPFASFISRSLPSSLFSSKRHHALLAPFLLRSALSLCPSSRPRLLRSKLDPFLLFASDSGISRNQSAGVSLRDQISSGLHRRLKEPIGNSGSLFPSDERRSAGEAA
ncbi:hypothetical protein NL676_030482 [Syzygium grande]|nr:hypothetical protein NL676_030482 [Syzygium grande]